MEPEFSDSIKIPRLNESVTQVEPAVQSIFRNVFISKLYFA